MGLLSVSARIYALEACAECGAEIGDGQDTYVYRITDVGGWDLYESICAACDGRGTCPVCGEATVGDERTGVCHAGQWEIRAVDVACRCARDKEGQGR